MKRISTLIVYFVIIYQVKAQEFGVNDLRISDMGTNGITSFFAFDPRIAYGATGNISSSWFLRSRRKFVGSESCPLTGSVT